MNFDNLTTDFDTEENRFNFRKQTFCSALNAILKGPINDVTHETVRNRKSSFVNDLIDCLATTCTDFDVD